MFMVFAGPVDLGPWFFVYFLIIGVIIAIPILAIGYFAYTLRRKLKPGVKASLSPDTNPNSEKIFAGILLGSIAFLIYYFSHTKVGPLLFVPYLVIVTFLIKYLYRSWVIRSAIVVILTLTIFAYNHYPQYSGRNCKNYPSFLECRTPRFNL